jgi:uncharacterized membrane protein
MKKEIYMNMEMVRTLKPALRGVNVGNTERRISLITGLALLFYVLVRRPGRKIAIPAALEAVYLLYRGATGHCVLYQAMEINRSQERNHGIRVQRAVTVNKPREELFRTWRNFENLPHFMHHLQSVRVDAGNGKQSHWVAKSPFGGVIEWDSEITDEVENELLAWRSLPGAWVENAGVVRFSDAPGGRGTIVSVLMQYNPPAGSMGAAVAKLLGEEPGQQVRSDLYHFKQIMETGELASVQGQTSGRDEARNRRFVNEALHQEDNIRNNLSDENDLVEQASDDSFPASDPPAWISSGRKRQRSQP